MVENRDNANVKKCSSKASQGKRSNTQNRDLKSLLIPRKEVRWKERKEGIWQISQVL